MTADEMATRLVELGLPAAERDGKRRLADTVLQAFTELHGARPAYAWWIPGRLEVFGKHTDYCGGASLVAALPRGLVLAAAPRKDRIVRIRDARRGEELTIDPDVPLGQPGTGWRNYAEVATRRLARNFPGAPLGADIVLASDLPPAAGMSSSSALVVGIATALVAAGTIRTRREWIENVNDRIGEAGYFACIENGMSYGALAGDAGVGTHGGSEDHAAILCSQASHLSMWHFVPIRHGGDVRVPEEWTFVIASSGVAARKTGDAREAYNRLSREARALLDLWNRQEPPAPSLNAALSSDPAAPARMRQLAGPAGLGHRLDHFLRENGRVAEAAEAFRRADRDRLSRLSDASQADAESLLQNQLPETSALARTARELGAFAASSFGAGFGGSVWALIDASDAPQFAARWLASYQPRFPNRHAATTFIAHPAPSLSLLG